MNATVILSAVMAVATSASTLSDFAYNNEIINGKVESQTVYEVQSQKYLQPHLKYNFAYDSQNRLSQKEVLKWNEQTRNYEKDHCLNISYNDGETAIEYASWDTMANAYSNVKEKAIYHTNAKGALEKYQSYEWNKGLHNWNLVVDHTTIGWVDALLINK